eukprot:sb/3469429/
MGQLGENGRRHSFWDNLISLSKPLAELEVIKKGMAGDDDTKEKLAEANRTIARLKGDLLKLTTEAQSAMLNENTADDALIEENEELKTQVEKLDEIKNSLMADVQILREQLDEANDEIDLLNEELEKKEDGSSKNNNRVSEVRSKLEAVLELKTQQIAGLEAQNKALLGELEEVKGRVTLLEGESKSKTSKIIGLKVRNAVRDISQKTTVSKVLLQLKVLDVVPSWSINV